MFWEKLNQNKICVILVVIICVLAGTFYSYNFTPKEYVSSSTVMLIKTKNNAENSGALELSDSLISTFKEVIKSELTVAEVKSNLKLDLDNKELNNKIDLKRVTSSDTFEINVKDSNLDSSIKINKEVLKVFSNRINDMYSENEVYIIDAPHISKTIYRTPIYIYSSVSALLGFCISAIYILILLKIEKNVKSVVDLEVETYLKTLAQIPLKQIDKKEKSVKSELICYDSEKSVISKAFKTLRTNLQFLSVNNEKQNKVVLVTSPMPYEGKSYVAANMAISFAEIGKKVLLLDADMNTGRLDKLFNIPNNLGFSNYLSNLDGNGVEINEFLNKFVNETAIKNLNLITSGTVPPNSSELLASSKMTDLIKDLKVFYDIVIIDGTSCLTSTDSLILTRLVGSTIIVANYRKTKKEDFLKTKRDIQNVGGKIIGVVLNRVKLKKKKKTKAERKEDFAKFKLNVKDKVTTVKKYIKDRITDSKQKLLTEKTSEIVDEKEKIILEENAENKSNYLTKIINIFKNKERLFLKNTENQQEKTLSKNAEKEQEKNKNAEKNSFKENDKDKCNITLLEKILEVIFGTKEKFVKNFSEKQEKNEKILEKEIPIVEENKTKRKEVKKEEPKKENVSNKPKNEEHQKEFGTVLENVKEKIVKAKDVTFEKTKSLKENTINTYNKTKENCVQLYNNLFEKENVSKETKELINEETEKVEKEIIQEPKKELLDDTVKNDNTILVIIDAENACCRVFSKECFTEKLIRGIDKTDGFPKAHYSKKLLRKRLAGIMNTYGLNLKQAKRVDSLVYITLCDYDDCMWLERKVPSNKSELYVQAMASEFPKEDGETEKEYLVRCQRLRKTALEKAELDIEYKLDNLWKTRKMNFFDKVTLKNFANLYDIDQKMKNDKEIQKSKKIKKFYSDIIQGAEKRLKKSEEKQNKEENGILEADKALKQEELRLEKEKLETEKREEQERIKAERKAEQEKNKKEKELQKQERKEENLKRKREKQKQKEEQRMQKELERENKEKEAKLEEELLVDNLYPKTKNNKNL